MEPLIQQRRTSLVEVKLDDMNVEVHLIEEDQVVDAPLSLKRIIHYGLCAVLTVIVFCGVAGLDHLFLERGTAEDDQDEEPDVDVYPSPKHCNLPIVPENLTYPICRLKILEGNAQSIFAGGQVSVWIQNADNISCSYAAISLRFNMSKTSLTEAILDDPETTVLPAPEWATASSTIIESLLPNQSIQARWIWFGPQRPTFHMEFCGGGFFTQLDKPAEDNAVASNAVKNIVYHWTPDQVNLKFTATSYITIGSKLHLDIEGIPINEMDITTQDVKKHTDSSLGQSKSYNTTIERPAKHLIGCFRTGLELYGGPGYGPIHCSWSEVGSTSRQMAWQFVRSMNQTKDENSHMATQVITQKMAMREVLTK